MTFSRFEKLHELNWAYIRTSAPPLSWKVHAIVIIKHDAPEHSCTPAGRVPTGLSLTHHYHIHDTFLQLLYTFAKPTRYAGATPLSLLCRRKTNTAIDLGVPFRSVKSSFVPSRSCPATA